MRPSVRKSSTKVLGWCIAAVVTGALAPTTATAAQDLGVTMTPTSADVRVGQSQLITVTVANNGADPTDGAQAFVSIPAGLTVDDGGNGAFDEGTGLWTLPPLAAAASTNLALTLTPTGAATLGVPLPVMVSVTDTEPDALANNLRLATITPTGEWGLSVNVEALTTPTVGGANANVFRVTLANLAGSETATNVPVHVPVPPRMSFNSATATAGTYSSATGLWTVPTLAAGASAQLTVNGSALAGGALSPTATLGTLPSFITDSSGSNTDAETITVATPAPTTVTQTNTVTQTVTQTATQTVTQTIERPAEPVKLNLDKLKLTFNVKNGNLQRSPKAELTGDLALPGAQLNCASGRVRFEMRLPDNRGKQRFTWTKKLVAKNGACAFEGEATVPLYKGRLTFRAAVTLGDYEQSTSTKRYVSKKRHPKP